MKPNLKHLEQGLYFEIDSSFDFGVRSLPFDYEEPLKSKRPRKWPPITPEMHQKIKRLYLDKTCCSGEVKEFAEQYGLPRWKISRYAQSMGWSAKQKKAPNWTDKELRVLKQSAHHSPETIQKKIKKNTALSEALPVIVLKRKRMRFVQNIDGQSAQSLSMCLGEDVHFVLRVIRNGLVKAKRRIQKPDTATRRQCISDKRQRCSEFYY